ncbi:GNAT family N-acetyltransferase [Pseudoxanthomonas suwonensis]|uniref:Acetyltransferase n=1 Tax=Pseudoxanthomonas suwonensis TaxID=314722 RepID=A0A0E3ULM6_9GAMM|nr:GNAT family N-acetyltransferase [Pseudoxanthomonas suwonensis]AKC85596.1 acetyltransferase [Pseudoxanthomonas suwonensis]
MSDATATVIEVRSAGLDDLPALAALFDGYRVFYGQPSDPVRAGAFLRERLERGDSWLLLAVDGQGAALGFVQLYPSFTSVGTAPIEILNDLFVAPESRGRGVARALLRRAADDARARGAVKLVLSTAVDNGPAQALYASEGWERDGGFVEYARRL